MSKLKPLLFAALAIVLFFGAVELVLWLLGVRPLHEEQDPFLGFSAQVRVFQLDPARELYVTPARAVDRSFNYQEFAAVKPAGGYRVFVLGGSSAYGFPWNAHSAFPHYLARGLRASFPDRPIEVVNAAAMSYASHRLRILTPEILGYEPDLLVVSGGHNEFIERRFYRDLLRRPQRLDRLQLALSHWRLYSGLTRGYRRAVAADRAVEPGGQSTAALLGLDVERDNAVDVEQTERREVRRRFEANIEAILDHAARADVRVVLCTVPSNIRGWQPNQSFFEGGTPLEHRRRVQQLVARARRELDRDDAAAAATSLERARGLAPGYAEAHYYLGQALEALGRRDEAREAFATARDADAKPTRAPGEFNEALRRLAARRNVHLVDIERWFEELVPHGLLGFNLFQDYVHPKPQAHRFIALALWKAVLEGGWVDGQPSAVDEDRFWAALDLPGRPALDSTAPIPQGDPSDPTLMFNLAVVLENHGRFEEAAEKYRLCRDMDPRFFVEAASNLGRVLTRLGRFEEAASEHRAVLAVAPEHIKSLIGLGEALRQLRRLERSAGVLDRATRVDRGSALAWNRLGVVLSELQRLPEGEQACRRAVELDPGNGEFRTDLGYTLLFLGRLDEAEPIFRRALELGGEPLRARNGLAAVLVERGELERAERLFRENLQIEPGDAYARQGLAIIEQRRSTSR